MLTTLAGLAVTSFFNRRRIAWRVYMDAPITLDPSQARQMGDRVIHKIYVADPPHDGDQSSAGGHQPPAEVKVPWLVLLRIRNSGRVTIEGREFNTPLTFTFPGREVRDQAVIDSAGDNPDKILVRPQAAARPVPPPASAWRLPGWIRGGRPRQPGTGGGPAASTAAQAARTPAAPGHPGVDRIQLSEEFALNRKDRITIMAVLSGTPADPGNAITVNGKLIGGRVDKELPRGGPGTRSLVSAAFSMLLLVGLLLGLLLSPAPPVPAGPACTGGTLTLTGSTAFSPVAARIAAAYRKVCPAVRISVAPNISGSVIGLNTLIADGRQGAAGNVLAMSDGPAPATGDYRVLHGTPVAIITFAVVVNRSVGLYNLTTQQVREIFSGAVTNWDQIGGANLPVRIISRDFGSGTRRAFDAYVLGGQSEPSPTSYDCRSKNSATAPVIACTVQRTQDLLPDVAGIPGAIGYSQTGDVTAYYGGGVVAEALNGLTPTFNNIGRSAGKYSYWTTEYSYTYGKPSPVAAAYLRYLSSPTALDIMRTADYTPCIGYGQPRVELLCTQSAA